MSYEWFEDFGAPSQRMIGTGAELEVVLPLGLHAITMALLLARGAATPEKLARWRKGALISFAVTVAIGFYFSNIAR